MTRREYTDRVLSALRRVTYDERETIRAEIDAHMEDHICALLDLGYDEALAEERTMMFMGDPEEVGRELDKQYPLRWLVIGRIAGAALTVVILVCLLGLTSLRNVSSNIQARVDPWEDYGSTEAKVNQKLDLREEIGSDILRIMGSGTKVTEDRAEAVVVFCKYDKNPFGYVPHGYEEIKYVDYRGEEARNGGGGGRSNAGASYWRDDSISVQYGDPYVTMVYTRFGTRYELQIPLKWEGEA